ncbi:MAG: SDR family NAD(P)-dependent oxidoreductase [Hyphomicrobiales bacterium]|nr:MAG: SDR family NAD(P)-dependent oxidoreductase [Hyphomicrobiales bacterium]
MTCQCVAGKIALITGGAQGMGAAHVRKLAEHGATLVFGDIETAAGKELADALQTRGLRAYFEPLDVSDAEDWGRISAIIEDLGGDSTYLSTMPAWLIPAARRTLPKATGTVSSTSIRRASFGTSYPRSRNARVGWRSH